MTAQTFLDAFCARVGVPAPSSEEAEALLRLASVAAHASERTAAPIACWVAGVSGRPLTELIAAAHGVADDDAA